MSTSGLYQTTYHDAYPAHDPSQDLAVAKLRYSRAITPLPFNTVEHEHEHEHEHEPEFYHDSRNLVKQLLGETKKLNPHFLSRVLKPAVNPAPVAKTEQNSLSRDEAMWFVSLPEKVQRRFFTLEEQFLLNAACENTLINIRDEINQSYHASLTTYQPTEPVIRNPENGRIARPNTAESEPALVREGGSFSSLRLPIHDFRSGGSICSSGSGYSRLPRERSHTLNSRSFSITRRRNPEPDQRTQEVATWLANTGTSATTTTTTSSSSSHVVRPHFYQDHETRMKLRQCCGSTEAFDEALEFGFPTIDTNLEARAAEVTGCCCCCSSTPKEEGSPKDQCGDRTLSLTRTETNSHSHTSAEFSESSSATSASVVIRPPFAQVIRVARSSSSLRPSERDMTLHMTLTKPAVRSPNDGIAGWSAGDDDANITGDDYFVKVKALPDPWALEPLPISNDDMGKTGVFEQVKEKKTIRDLFRGLRRRQTSV